MKDRLQKYKNKYKGKKFWLNNCITEVIDVTSTGDDKYIYVKLQSPRQKGSMDIRYFEKNLKNHGYVI